jgi:phage anti-repressor protein
VQRALNVVKFLSHKEGYNMNELIRIQDFNGKKAVSARDLYDFLGIKKDFTTWCKRMFGYDFEEGTDFPPIRGESSGGRPSLDYALSIDCAKELSMLQRTQKGKRARQYFIECEKQLKEISVKPLSIAEILQQSIQLHITHEKKMMEIEQKQIAIEDRVNVMTEIQKTNELELFDLPISQEPVQAMKLRDQIRLLVTNYALATGIQYKIVWDTLYSDLNYRYHILLRGHKRDPKETILDVADSFEGTGINEDSIWIL